MYQEPINLAQSLCCLMHEVEPAGECVKIPFVLNLESCQTSISFRKKYQINNRPSSIATVRIHVYFMGVTPQIAIKVAFNLRRIAAVSYTPAMAVKTPRW